MRNKASVASRVVGTLLAIAFCQGSASAVAGTISGGWFTDDRTAIVRIGPCGQKLCGTVERMLDPRAPEHDINNPDKKLRSRPLVGVVILKDFSPTGSGWSGGRVYDPKSGKSYRSELALLEDGRLRVTGCVLFVCRSRYWSRAQSPVSR